MRSPTPLHIAQRRWPLGKPETPAPAHPRCQGRLDETLSAQRRCSARPAIGILLGPQLGGDNPILVRVEWVKTAADIDSELAETLSASPAQP